QKKPRSSKHLRAATLPDPDKPVMIMNCVERSWSDITSNKYRLLTVGGSCSGLISSDPCDFVDLSGELGAGVVALAAQQEIPGSDLDQDRDIPAWGNRHSNQRQIDPQNFVAVLIQTQPVIFNVVLPAFQGNDKFDLLVQADG